MKDKFRFVLSKELDDYSNEVFTATRKLLDIFMVTWIDSFNGEGGATTYKEEEIARYIEEGSWIVIED